MLQGDVNIKVKDKRTGELKKEINTPMNSFVSNFISLLYVDFLTTNPSVVAKDLDNTTVTGGQLGRVDASAGTGTHGGVIGTGTTAESCDQYDLATRATTATVTHGGTNIGDAEVSGSNAIMTINRTFTNIEDTPAGADIVVAEIGVNVLYSTNNIMIIRDKLDSTITISDDESMEFTYTLSVGSGLTLNFMKMLESIFDYESVSFKSTTYTDTQAEVNFATSTDARAILAAEDVTSYGIQIGSDDTAEDVEDYKLGSQITTDVTHYVVTPVSISRDTGTGITKFKFSRQFTNNTGGNISINEVGIVAAGSGASSRIMLARYVLPTTLTVADGYSVIVRPRISTTM